jgi:predicted transcriptional regulator
MVLLPKHKDEAWLIEQYVDNEKSLDALAQMANVDKKVIIDALNNFRIYRKYDHTKHPKSW